MGAKLRRTFDPDLPALYRAARTSSTTDFQQALLAYLCEQLGCHYGATNTWHGGDVVAANTFGRTDQDLARMNMRWREMARPDLDVLSATACAMPGRATCVNADDPRLLPAEMRPIRAFMAEFDVEHAIAIALELGQWGCTLLLSLVRGPGQPPFGQHELDALTRFGPHAGECVSINYVLSTASERSPMGRRTLALLNDRGHAIQVSEGFATRLASLMAPDGPRKNTVPAQWMEAARAGRPLVLRDERAFITFTRLDGCWLAELKEAVGGALTARQLEVALLYVNGWSYKDLAQSLKIAPATARVHLQNVFAKLEVSSRKTLREALLATPRSGAD